VKFFTLVILFTTPYSMLSQSSAPQKFICNTGYTLQQCHRQMSTLRPVLDKFHADALGQWTWILVRSEDWRPLMYRLDASPDSPAVTFLDKRTTLFEEALMESSAANRAELLRYWGLPLNQLLDEAVSHELGHSFCNDPDEARAERRARALQEGKKLVCEAAKEIPSGR
jgi:hypothetical protein